MQTNRTLKKNHPHQKTGLAGFLSKFSQGLMIPIAILPIAGLCLGLGSGLINIFNVAGFTNDINSEGTFMPGIYILPGVVAAIGDVIFANLPILFGMAAAITFTKDNKGIAAITIFVLWMTMNVFMGFFFVPNIIIDSNGNEVIGSYDMLFYKDVPTSVTTNNLGVLSLQTSVFGGLTVGFISSWLTNSFSEKEMPKLIEFFSGTRLVPILGFLIAPVVGSMFLLTWPIIGIELNKLGALMAGMPVGLNSLMYGLISRSLLPFGLHHAFYTPLWFTSVGSAIYGLDGTMVAEGDQGTWFYIIQESFDFTWINYSISETLNHFLGFGGNLMVNPIIDPETGEAVGFITAGAKPGMYLQGYPDYIFGLPAAGAAMIMAAPKGKGRELAYSVILASIFTSFLTGITEPIQYTFLFLSPLLYVFHIIMFGMANWWMNLSGANIGVTFSAGFIDWFLYGIIPAISGFHTRWWTVIPIGIVEAVIYFTVFYFYILKKDLPTPGREGGVTALITKNDYNIKKQVKNNDIDELIELLGGIDNLNTIDNCITRLRLSVKNDDIIRENELKIKSFGAIGIVYLKHGNVQIIFGAKAEKYKTQINKRKKQNE